MSNANANQRLPIVVPYRNSGDGGLEFKHAIRSWSNLQEWNGQLFVIGDSEEWFSDKIIHIPHGKSANSPYTDVNNKLLVACNDGRISDDFIVMNDDFFCRKPAAIPTAYKGKLADEPTDSHYRQSLHSTNDWLIGRKIDKPLNYELHIPIIINKAKWLQTYAWVRPSLHGLYPLQWRSVYGNMHAIGGKQMNDVKTHTDSLKRTVLISTKFYTAELERLFSNPSEYERDSL